MNQQFFETLREYYLVLDSIERRIGFWDAFCHQAKLELKRLVGNTDSHLSYFENEGNKSFGATIKIVPCSDMVEVDGIRIYAEKKSPMLVIRLDHQGFVIFEFISSHFNSLNQNSEIKLLRDPVSPRDFDYQEMTSIVINFIKNHIEWENTLLMSK